MISSTMDASIQRWIKKEVPLSWNRLHLSFAVAQELFSSHQIDTGSLLLLRSLEPDMFAERGSAVDYGCGYGVLGLAWKAARPMWDVHLIDRDALAVEFAAWNASRVKLDITAAGGLDLSEVPREPHLVLWNVPGKAGAQVLQHLLGHVMDSLSEQGLLALVVVHPLKDELLRMVQSRADSELVFELAGSDHTVLHIRKVSPSGSPVADTFAAGVFDRNPVHVDTGLIEYQFQPVVGLPNYDGPDFATVLHTDAIESVLPKQVNRAVCVGTGQGHLPMYVRTRWPEAEVTLIDRDALALRASARLVGGAFHTSFAAIELGTWQEPFELISLTLPDQIRPPVMQYWLSWAVEHAVAGTHISLGGGSTEVSRFLALAAKHRGLKLRSRDRNRGQSGANLEVRILETE